MIIIFNDDRSGGAGDAQVVWDSRVRVYAEGDWQPETAHTALT